MRINEKIFFEEYLNIIGHKIPNLIKEFDFSQNLGDFDYLTKASAVYSSNIEGNTIDLNSFMNYQLNKDKFKAGKEIDEIEDLIKAYNFAQTNELNEKNLLKCHEILSATFLIKRKRGKYRNEPVGVFSRTGLAYLAIEPEFLAKEMHVFFEDLSELLSDNLNEIDSFYFAALIHLRFAHIHPFREVNGRVARLLEKWFLARKLGDKFWRIPSEEYYKNNQVRYYETINLGLNFYELKYEKSINFLEMLPNCLASQLPY
jgi:Fic family protein